MEELIFKYGTVFFSSMFKFMMGSMMGAGMQLSIHEIALLTFLGTMSGVILFTYIGTPFKDIITKNMKRKGKYRLFSKKNRRIVRIWQNFGMKGVAFLTPPFLTPVAGTIIAISFSVRKRKLWLHMAISTALWSYPTAYFFLQIEHGLHNLF